MDAADRRRVVVGCLLAITFGTGVVDATSWVALTGVFTANMTGNVLLVGIGAVGGGGAGWFPAVFALCCFLVGAGCAARWTLEEGTAWTWQTTIVLAVVAIVIAAVAVVAALWPPTRLEPLAFGMTAALAAAAGAQAAAAVRLAVPGLSTVAVTSATVGVGTSLFLGAAARGSGVPRRLLAIVLLAAGACCGAVLAPHGVVWGLALGAATTFAAVVVGDSFARERG